MVLAAVLLSPVALGAGETAAVSPLAEEHGNAAKTLSFNASADRCVWSKPDPRGGAGTATLSVWNLNKAARQLLILRLESLKWP